MSGPFHVKRPRASGLAMRPDALGGSVPGRSAACDFACLADQFQEFLAVTAGVGTDRPRGQLDQAVPGERPLVGGVRRSIPKPATEEANRKSVEAAEKS